MGVSMYFTNRNDALGVSAPSDPLATTPGGQMPCDRKPIGRVRASNAFRLLSLMLPIEIKSGTNSRPDCAASGYCALHPPGLRDIRRLLAPAGDRNEPSSAGRCGLAATSRLANHLGRPH
jgi:hypothetical protein